MNPNELIDHTRPIIVQQLGDDGSVVATHIVEPDQDVGWWDAIDACFAGEFRRWNMSQWPSRQNRYVFRQIDEGGQERYRMTLIPGGFVLVEQPGLAPERLKGSFNAFERMGNLRFP